MSADAPATCQELAADLAALGVRPGRDLLVHASMRRLGPITGGAAATLLALRAASGPHATLVAPTQTAGNSLSSRAFLRAIAGLDQAGRAAYIAAMPGFDRSTTPSAAMGALAEHLRTRPGAIRSAHPQTSFAALGPRAAECTAGHLLDCHLGERSPLGWLYRADAAVLLLGVGYAACTAFHLAEYRLPGPAQQQVYRCFTATEGERRKEQAFTDIVLDDSDFEEIGAEMDREPFMRASRVGRASCRLFPVRDAVDFALDWPPFAERRRPRG
jgi:aminoglycoside 3-N-acetyltransferase